MMQMYKMYTLPESSSHRNQPQTWIPQVFSILFNAYAQFSSLGQNLYLHSKRYLFARCTISQPMFHDFYKKYDKTVKLFVQFQKLKCVHLVNSHFINTSQPNSQCGDMKIR